jgi:surface polysaccharide O-acyltransferase-like enzyme
MCSILVFHTLAQINGYHADALTQYEKAICISLVNLWQWCVPIFVMITGVLLLNPHKEITIEKLIKKYIFRVFLAIMLFGIPFAFIEIFFNANYHFHIKQIGEAILNTIQGDSFKHLWYLYMIAGLYLIIPMIKIFISSAEKRTVEYLLLLLLFFTSFIPFLKSIFSFNFGIYIPINSIFVFYLILGHYIHFYKINVNNIVIFIIIIFYILFSVVMSLNGNFFLKPDGILLSLTTNIYSPITILVTIAVFCLIRKISVTPNKLLNSISSLVFGIYLIHMLFINFIYKFLKFTPERFPLIVVLLGTFTLTSILSIGFTYCLRKIKILKLYLL